MEQLLTCSSDPISLLLTTTTTPSLASAHANLLAMLRVISANQSVAGLSIHLLGIGETKLRLRTYILTWLGFAQNKLDTVIPRRS